MCSGQEPPAKVVSNLEKSINRITLLGRVGIDPQLRGSDASPVVVFTLATNHNYRFETGEIQQKTEWHRISIFKPHLRTTVSQNVRKGHRVFIDGRLVYGEIIDARGLAHTTSTIVASDVICFGASPEA
ncbi:single-stranded DNA-binding protein, mitochondrial-like isoform X2 [Varroa jacobsoni]|nr:single-stranded DNA-binding protein, mitochondrial-like isoform X2 [Varroa jacobsoni]